MRGVDAIVADAIVPDGEASLHVVSDGVAGGGANAGDRLPEPCQAHRGERGGSGGGPFDGVAAVTQNALRDNPRGERGVPCFEHVAGGGVGDGANGLRGRAGGEGPALREVNIGRLAAGEAARVGDDHDGVGERHCAVEAPYVDGVVARNLGVGEDAAVCADGLHRADKLVFGRRCVIVCRTDNPKGG